MENLNSEIEKIKYEIEKKEIQNHKIKELEKLAQNKFISENQIQVIDKKIKELKKESLENNIGIRNLNKFRLDIKKTSLIKEETQFIYPDLIESGKIMMFFGDSGIGKTLMVAGFANYGLLNQTIKSAIFFDFDNGLISLKKRNYDQLSEQWGIGKFDYLLGEEILQEMEPISALKELLLDGNENKDKMIVIDSGSHFVYDGSKNERQNLKEFFDVIRTLRHQKATIVVIHHSHRVRDGQTADYHGSFEWKRDLDYQFLITKNEDTKTWLFHVKKDRDNLIESKAFRYLEDTISLEEVSFEEANVSNKEFLFVKEIQEILKDFDEKINQTDLLKESRSIRQSLSLGDKRSIKWLQSFAEKGRWASERIPSEKNAIFYWIEKNLPCLPNTDLKEPK